MGDDVHSVAVVALHPIQYQVGLWRAMAQHPRLRIKVFYLDPMGVDGTIEPTLNVKLAWDMPMLDGYDHEFVPNWSPARFTPIINRINPALVWHLARDSFDAVLLHGYQPITNWLALAVSRLKGIPIIYRGEGTMIGEDEVHRGAAVDRLKVAMNRTFLLGSNRVAYSSADNMRFQLSRGARDSSLFPMPCAIDNEQLARYAAQAKSPEVYRLEMGLPQDAKLVLTAGRFTPRKRFEDCIRAVARLEGGDRQVHLLIAGNGPDGSDRPLRAAAKEFGLSERVHLLGWLSPAAMVEAITVADVFVMASSHDPSPKAMSEALAVGVPIVCSDKVGTANELVAHGRNGFVYPCGDVEALSRYIEEVLATSERRDEMAQASKEIAKANDFAAATERLVEALDEHQGSRI